MIFLLLVSSFLSLSGILNASKDEAGFKRALLALLAGIVIDIIISILQNSNASVANWLRIVSMLCTMVVTVFVLQGISILAGNLGKKAISNLCAKCQTYFISAFSLSAAAQVFVALQAAESTMRTTSGIVAYLMQIVAYVFYIRVLNKARLMQ